MDLLVLVCPRGPPKSQITIVETVRKKRPKTRWDPAPPTAPKPIATRDCTRTRRHLMAVRLARWRTDRWFSLGNKIASGPPNRSNRVPNTPELRFSRQDFIIFRQFVYSLYIPKITPCTLQISLSFGNLYIPFIYRKSAIRYRRFFQ